MSIAVADVRKTYGAFTALAGVELEIETGELLALLGPSGCGKTTRLRVIAGLERPDAGAVSFDGVDTAASGVGSRGVGFVSQHYALFRHLTVFENVAFGLDVRPRGTRPPKAEIRRRVHELLELVMLEHMADRLPSQLSPRGGERTRRRPRAARTGRTLLRHLRAVAPDRLLPAHEDLSATSRRTGVARGPPRWGPQR